jgi:hypothetical protein
LRAAQGEIAALRAEAERQPAMCASGGLVDDARGEYATRHSVCLAGMQLPVAAGSRFTAPAPKTVVAVAWRMWHRHVCWSSCAHMQRFELA